MADNYSKIIHREKYEGPDWPEYRHEVLWEDACISSDG